MKKILTILIFVSTLCTAGYAQQSFNAFGENNAANAIYFAVSPNPANSNFTLLYDYNRDSCVEVYNILGILVARLKPETEFDALVDCSKWENGYYFCKLLAKQKVQKTIKLIIAH